jgi:hypothetical protein
MFFSPLSTLPLRNRTDSGQQFPPSSCQAFKRALRKERACPAIGGKAAAGRQKPPVKEEVDRLSEGLTVGTKWPLGGERAGEAPKLGYTAEKQFQGFSAGFPLLLRAMRRGGHPYCLSRNNGIGNRDVWLWKPLCSLPSTEGRRGTSGASIAARLTSSGN